MGHGAGGAAVHFHMMANHHAESKGKFSAGISISGTAFNSWALHNDREQALNLTKRFAKSLRCSIHGKTETLMRCLRERKGSELVKAQIQFLVMTSLYYNKSLSQFTPKMSLELINDKN